MERNTKVASYKEAIKWIAYNDDAGCPNSLSMENVAGYISTCLVADLFGCSTEKVANDIIKLRMLIKNKD